MGLPQKGVIQTILVKQSGIIMKSLGAGPYPMAGSMPYEASQ
jgi:hypothetical protein